MRRATGQRVEGGGALPENDAARLRVAAGGLGHPARLLALRHRGGVRAPESVLPGQRGRGRGGERNRKERKGGDGVGVVGEGGQTSNDSKEKPIDDMRPETNTEQMAV